MSMPNIPDINPKMNLDRDEVINLLLTSIAMEEMSLSNLLNAEGEKLQKLLCSTDNVDDLFKINQSVDKTIRTIIKQELLLLMKLESVIELSTSIPPKEECECENNCPEWDDCKECTEEEENDFYKDETQTLTSKIVVSKNYFPSKNKKVPPHSSNRKRFHQQNHSSSSTRRKRP